MGESAAGGDGFGFDRFAACAAFGVEETEKILQGFCVGGVPEECAVAPHGDKALILELVEVMGEGGSAEAELVDDVADDHAFRMRGQQHGARCGGGVRCRERRTCRRTGLPGLRFAFLRP